MIALTWQTVLILTIAYFAGCIVGCLARKLFGAGAVAGTEPAFETAIPAPVAAPPRDVSRAAVASAPAHVTEPTSPSATRPVPGAAAPKAFRRADVDTPDDVAAPEADTAPEPPQAEPTPIRSRDVPPPATLASPVSAAAAVAAAVAERMAVPTPPIAQEPTAPAGDDLTRIRAIDAEWAAKLNDLGFSRYADIAAWTSDDVRTVSDLLGLSGRIERENWIEQAQILARGGATSYATGLASAALRAAAPPQLPERGPEVSTRAAFAEPRRAVPPPAPAAMPVPASVSSRDTLQRIGGISAEIEDVLGAHDITRYSQIAGWSADDVARVESLLGFSGRISRENWIEQAQILARGGATAYSRTFDERGGPPVPAASPAVATPAPAPEPTISESPPAERVADLSGMRSVRSEAFRAPDSMAATSHAAPDDLKRIRGVGLLIERKLNAMGVSTYEQIANWTADDVSTVNAKLEFKGRIERENWIEQARILASGGQTDFSRRFERGEV
jgi:predicted flap endonuclease-1-like 5' DNA nuclease